MNERKQLANWLRERLGKYLNSDAAYRDSMWDIVCQLEAEAEHDAERAALHKKIEFAEHLISKYRARLAELGE